MTSLHYQAKLIILSGKSSLLHYQAYISRFRGQMYLHYPGNAKLDSTSKSCSIAK